MLFTRNNLTVGDTVRVQRQDEFKPMYCDRYVLGVVTGLPAGGVAIDAITYENVGGTMFEILRFANGVPNTIAVAWWDYDRAEHVAIRSGHPLNHAWVYNGRRVTTDEIAALAGTMPVAGLEFVQTP